VFDWFYYLFSLCDFAKFFKGLWSPVGSIPALPTLSVSLFIYFFKKYIVVRGLLWDKMRTYMPCFIDNQHTYAGFLSINSVPVSIIFFLRRGSQPIHRLKFYLSGFLD
jgi:hypothetical protein